MPFVLSRRLPLNQKASPFSTMPEEYLDPKRSKYTESALLAVLIAAPRNNSEEKLEYFMDGSSLIVKQLLTIHDCHNAGGFERFLVWWQSFFGAAGKTKSLMQPIVMFSIIINFALILGFDHTSAQATFELLTYSRWEAAYYILYVLAPAHFVMSIGSFIAFLRIDLATLVEMENRKAQRASAKYSFDDSDGLEALQWKALQSGMDGLSMFAASLQATVDRILPFGLGRFVPIEQLFILRNSIDFWFALISIVMSIAGTLLTPLFFSFHLLRVAQLPELQIVISSITTNGSRLVTTCLLAVVAIYLFAIFGVFQFEYSLETVSVSHGWRSSITQMNGTVPCHCFCSQFHNLSNRSPLLAGQRRGWSLW